MPNKKGGKKFKRGKKQGFEDKKLILKNTDEGQEYAKITKVNGSARYQVFCFDGKERLGILAGNIKRRTRLVLNDIVLVSLWDFQDTKCSIVHKYDEDEAHKLKDQGEFPDTIKLEEDNVFDDIEGGIDFTYDLPSSDEEDKEEEIDLDEI